MERVIIPVSGRFSNLIHLTTKDIITQKFGLTCLGIFVLTFLIYFIAEIFDQRSPFAMAVVQLIALNEDGGFAELLGYGAAFIAASNFFLVYLDRRRRSLLFVVLLISFIGLDDSLSYHEDFGRYLVKEFDFKGYFGLRDQDTGEVVAWSLAGLVLGSIFLWSLSSTDKNDLGILLVLAVPLALLGVCGVILDMFHVLAAGQLGRLIGIAEDGGELLALIAIAIISVGVLRNASPYYDEHHRARFGSQLYHLKQLHNSSFENPDRNLASQFMRSVIF